MANLYDEHRQEEYNERRKKEQSERAYQLWNKIDRYMAEEGVAPTFPEMARLMGCSRSTIFKYLALLEADGRVAFPQRGEGGRRLTRSLRLLYTEVDG